MLGLRHEEDNEILVQVVEITGVPLVPVGEKFRLGVVVGSDTSILTADAQGVPVEHDAQHAGHVHGMVGGGRDLDLRDGAESVIRAAALPEGLYMGVPAKERRRRAEEVMERMNISHREKHFPNQLSGGQQQRVAIARAVIAGPKLILADEPTGNLDSVNGQEVMNLLKELNQQGTTIVMVTHSRHDASYANRIINLFDGSIVKELPM